MRANVRSFLQAPGARVALACASALLFLPAFELGYRLQAQRPALVLEDWRGGRVEDLLFGDRVRFDAELGWALRDEYESPRYNTLEYGVRRNFCEKDIRTGGILAVGDVFTDGGTEVTDSETWPAQLERSVDVPVLNGGVAGYAADQIVLRAEQLIEVAQPKVIIVGMHEESIARVSYSSYGTPKPYHTIESGTLVYHPPVRSPAAGAAAPDLGSRVRDVLGYSAVLDVVLASVAPAYWQGEVSGPVFGTVSNDPAAITCALLRRLKARADAAGARVLLLLQYPRGTIAHGTPPGEAVGAVAACATAAGLEVVDQLPSLRAAAAANAAAVHGLYILGGFGQMTRSGNRATAELLAGVLGQTAK